MDRVLVVVLLAVQAAVAPGGVLPRGARLVARMDTTIGTTHTVGVDDVADETRAGAPFAATLEATIVDEHGRTRLPAGAIVYGHVARVARGHGVERAKIELAIDRIERWPVVASVVASELQQLPATDEGVAVDTAAFWGMLFGGIAFGVPGVVIGHGMAGSYGAVNAVRARAVEGWISAGSLVTIELDEPLPLDGCRASC